MFKTICTRYAACVLLGFSQFASAQNAPAPNPDTQLHVRFQQIAQAPSGMPQLQFIGYHDARCPANVRCIAAGEASAIFRVTGAGIMPQIIVLPWSGGEPAWDRAARVGTHRFLLRSLEPRPIDGGMVEPGDYVALVDIRGG